MVQTKKLIPEVYSESFDMSVFTGLLDLVYTARELNQLRARHCHSARMCFDVDLSRLASLFGLPSSSQRELLLNYRLLVKEKGTATAVKAAVAYSSNVSPLDSSVIIKYINGSSGGSAPTLGYSNKIIAYADFSSIDTALLERLLYRLAPVGTFVQVRPLSELSK